ncbi:hypothetical protein AC579_8900 [Pseudocercospora musae]|uniref:Uncharacterized protein n=1 Tax=Pseudocercospora musae TaxID=113226 RepID=A0A139IDF3_9PEZI|nr:hypothetical protein AC579_8900 [Pseudocercospora musae]
MEAAVRWSPFSTSDREKFLLVDVTDQSISLNEVDHRNNASFQFHAVAKYGRLPNFGAFDWSKTDEQIVALGLVSGSACLIRLSEDERPSETVAIFKLKQQRKCNSIALSTENWLAVALDKTRSDNCLNIYDGTIGSSSQDPVRRLCPAEVVSSVRFFPGQPQELIVAAQRSYLRLYDLRDGYSGSNSIAQVGTRNVNNIAIDPLDENCFATAGSTGDPGVTVWDKRWISQSSSGSGGALFEFHPAVDNSQTTTIWSLRYSGQRRGRLAICSSRGELKVVDMVESHSSLLQGSEYFHTTQHASTPWTQNRYVTQSRNVQRPSQDAKDGEDSARLIAFDWIIGSAKDSEQKVLALRPNRGVAQLRVPFTVQHAAVTPRHDLSLAFHSVSILEAKPPVDYSRPQAPYEHQRTAEDFGPLDYNGELENGRGEDEKFTGDLGSPQLTSMLSASSIQRERCRRGYLFDCHLNKSVVSGNWQLEQVWDIIDRFRSQAANSGMVAEHQRLDLSFVGVAGVCTEKIGKNANRSLSPLSGKVEDAIADLAASRNLPQFSGERTNFPAHRQLCLEMCGWKYTMDSLEEECQELIDRGLHYQAIVQAVLHDYKHLALNMLRSLIRSKTVPNIGLGALLASDTINEDQREMCQWMAADTEDPALKALLTFLLTGNWRDVMETNYLHLGYRVALGLKYLNDTELRGFIQSETARAIKNGDLEGVLLTGLGEPAMDLFQSYLTRTNDLQTAVLATAFTNPAYVDDARWDMWKETYWMQMQSWQAFTHRSRFIVQHSHMARAPDGSSLLQAPRASVTLQCGHCQLSLAKYDGRNSAARISAPPSNVKGTAAIAAGIVCPKCGRHMPRCGICKKWLGTADPNRRGGAKELQKLGDCMAKFLTFCVSCEHGFHADHAMLWFKKHETCPVPGCGCLCTVK